MHRKPQTVVLVSAGEGVRIFRKKNLLMDDDSADNECRLVHTPTSMSSTIVHTSP